MVVVVHGKGNYYDVQPGVIGTMIRFMGNVDTEKFGTVIDAWEVRFPGRACTSYVAQHVLKKIDPPEAKKEDDESYDGNTIVSWDSCPWQPTAIKQPQQQKSIA